MKVRLFLMQLRERKKHLLLETSDGVLVQYVLAGDHQAFEILVNRYVCHHRCDAAMPSLLFVGAALWNMGAGRNQPAGSQERLRGLKRSLSFPRHGTGKSHVYRKSRR